MTAVEVRDLAVRIDGHEILRGIDLTVAAGGWANIVKTICSAPSSSL